MANRIWILGASDPEMKSIEVLLARAGEEYLHATVSGVRVHPGNAYKSDSPVMGEFDGDYVAVECGWPCQPQSTVVVDHHRAGDPGYGVPPADFVRGSSLGQVAQLLGVQLDPEETVAAAADHCLAAAYRGECPGVNPVELMTWRASTRAKFQHREVSAVLADIEAARAALMSAPSVEGWEGCRDMRATPTPELPEAATRDSLSYVAGPITDRDGRKKITCSGSEQVIKNFLAGEGPARGLTGLYGDPVRGFAGGYLPGEE